MAMTVANNSSAALALGELNKNVTSLGKQLKKVATGTKITGAGDSAAEYTISDRMRVRQRALEQDAANVQTGTSMLKVAEGAIQEQLEIMKTIKAKVIDANNDSNTDSDRVTIQKEISQGLELVNDIAYETTYNGKLLLVGNEQVEEIYTWLVLDEPALVPESDSLNLIEDQYDELDDQVGPFATLPFYSITDATAEPLLGSATSVNLEHGDNGYRDDPQVATATVFSFDFNGYTSSNAEGLGFYTAGNGTDYYVLTNDPNGKNYRRGNSTSENVIEINISGCTTSAQIAARVAATVSYNSTIGTASVDGTKVVATTRYRGASTANASVGGWDAAQATIQVPDANASSKQYGRTSATATGLGNKSASGVPDTPGQYHPAVMGTRYDPATDTMVPYEVQAAYRDPDVPGTKASLQLDISSVATGSGFSISGSGGTAYVRFVEGSSIERDSTGVYEIGKDASESNFTLYAWNTYNPNSTTDTKVRLSISGGQLTLTSTNNGAVISTRDGFTSEPEVPASSATTKPMTFSQVRAYGGSETIITAGVDQGEYHWGPDAYYDIDLTDYDVTDEEKLEEFIDALKGKTITGGGAVKEFIDTKVASSMDAMKHMQGGSAVDLNSLRTAVAGGSTIADAFIGMMTSSGRYSNASDATAGTKVLRINAVYHSELSGNNEKVSITQGNMSSYTIDFKSYFENNSLSIPADLDGKGFRLYCATCADQWFNFQFKAKDDPSDATRPPSGQSGADLKTTIIDVSAVTDVTSLVQAIYDQGGDAMEHIMNGQPHTLHFAADPEAGTLTVYDKRMYKLTTAQHPYLQEKGAKLGDGLVDDVHKATRGVFVNDFIIHHTDKASMNIHVRVPQTSLDHLFNYIEGVRSRDDFNVLTQARREELLGNQAGRKSPDGSRMVKNDEPGLLDRAIQYLTDANTLVGAQTSRLEMTHDNIIIQQEATTSSESTIRDADMAKEMTEYTKSNVLTQAAQSMLAQANQNGSGVLSLLQ